MKSVHSSGCVVTHEVRVESVSEMLYRDAKKLKRQTINGENPGSSERPNKKSSENDTSREVSLNKKLATPEGHPGTDASIDRRDNCCIKHKMASNGDSPPVKKSKFKEMGGITEAGSVRVDNKLPSNLTPYCSMNQSQPMIPCKGSGRVSKSSATCTMNLTKSNISGSNGDNFKQNKPLVAHVPTTRRALRFVDDDDGGEDCKTPIHRAKMTTLYKPQSGNSCQTTGTADVSQSYSMEQKYKLFPEKSKIGPSSSNQATVGTENIATGNISVECYDEKDVLGGQRSDITREATSTDSADSKLTESAMSMKHLIAAAQAKRREAHSRQLVDENDDDPFQTNKKYCQTSVPIEPSPVSRQFILMKQGEREDDDGKPCGGNQQPDNSSIDGTEAAIARDALEGMIETLSRTKESIGRATRHSIDCAKYGIATEVVDLLIRKLEGEPNFSRRIDLFFLVDSITQCSHNQKGIAGASYVPVVQAALPRLLCAAAPPGASARENRRQCLKVLRLWLERRILPEYFLRHYMDEIEFRNGGKKSVCSLRKQACPKFSVDDPLRETESLLVDEYGSNTTFLFPGFLSGHVLDDTEGFQGSVCNATADCSPNEADSVSEVLLGSEDQQMQTHRHLLEHLENEIEMEDALTISPDEQFIGGNPSFNLAPYEEHCWAVETKCDNQHEFPLPKGSPPLPLDPPPIPPPLPLSPPPPSPPLPSSPPPLPPPLSLPRISPPPPLTLQAELSATISVTQSPLPSLPYLYESRHFPPQEYNSMAVHDTQLLQPVGNSDIENPITVGLIEETAMSPDFVMPEVRNTNSMLSTISSRPALYFGREICHSEQLFQLCGQTIQQLSFQSSLPASKILNHPRPSSQIQSNHLCHWKSMHQQHLPQKYNSFPLSSFPHGQTKYSAMEQRRSHPCDANQYHYGAWNGDVRPSCSSASSAKDAGYSRLNAKGASVSVDFHHPTHYLALSRASLPDHNSPNFPAIDSWRPA